MSTKLIYHTPESMAGGVSPFDIAILDMVEDQEVRIACPYLGLSYLERVLERASGWQLLSDVQEWLASYFHESRSRIVEFILANPKRVRHCKDLHAKVLIAGKQALIGSANFTEKGITGRVEVSVLFNESEQIEELRAWFELLWNQSAPVREEDLRLCVTSLPPREIPPAQSTLPCAFPDVLSHLHQLAAASGSEDAENELIERLRQAPDRAWAESYLDLAKELVEITGLSNDDPRLVMSLRQGNTLPITINRRYGLTAFRLDEGQHEKRWLVPDYTNPPGHAVVELILPGSMKEQIDGLPGVIRHSSFDPGFSGETSDNVPRFVSFSVRSRFTFGPEVLEGWQQVLLTERDHGRASPYRRFHEPTVFRAVMDPVFRRHILNRAFSS